MSASKQTLYAIPYLTSSQIRKSFIDFFKAKDHRFVKSDSIAPAGDPTLLFTNSGMNQFKGIFLGDNPLALKRAVNSQKCLRVSGKHNDLEEVGYDGHHHTFFEMLGNWSFGDYYKKEAIIWAWELLTKIWQIPKNRLFVTVYKDDDEAFDLWKSCTDVDPSRILRFEKENFWEMGPVGPCGPCSEIHFDMGDLATQEATYKDLLQGVNGPNERYIEIWNLVFMQNERLPDGSLKALSDRHVDTGSGLERVCRLIQGVRSNYETDLFLPIIEKIAFLSKKPYGPGAEGICHRVISDHIRTLCFAIADGVTPGNDGRGYVIRRILRRACRYAHRLGFKEPILYQLVVQVIEAMNGAYEEIIARRNYIEQVIFAEEERFLKTLDQGLGRLDKLIQQQLFDHQKQLEGKDAFLFHDTFGFPIDLTCLIAKEHGLLVDTKAFERLMDEQKQRARSAAKFSGDLASDECWQVFDQEKGTNFVGYQQLEVKVKIKRYREEADTIYLVLDQTPFYAESGGQVGDQGLIEGADLRLQVLDTFKMMDMHIHRCQLLGGLLNPKQQGPLIAKVDTALRDATRKNHSATHLLHSALRAVLGSHVSQQGSYVGPDRLRFDFTHHKALSKDELEQVEDLVNQKIQAALAIQTIESSFDEAKKSGAMALFGEKYGDRVRCLKMGDFSFELCGGTHVLNTGAIGIFKILAETSIAAGVRRIEALTSFEAISYIKADLRLLKEISEELKTPGVKLLDKVKEINQNLKEKERLLGQMHQASLREQAKALAKKAEENGSQLFVSSLSNQLWSKEDLNHALDFVVELLPSHLVFLTHSDGEQLSLLLGLGKKLLIERPSLKAGELIKSVGAIVEAKGGGRADRARAASRQVDKESSFLKQASDLLLKAF